MDKSGLATRIGAVVQNVERVIFGKHHEVELAMVALVCRGHILVEDVPGTGKTVLAKAIARSLGCSFKRIQFTPDLLPSDVTGVSIFNQRTSQFEFRPGPVMTQIVLADEINRATPKTQSALLEAMEEHQVTVDGVTYQLPDPFLVMATQNPIETEGTYALPEAQVDRFMMKVLITYPSEMDEFVVVERMTSPLTAVQPVLTTEQLIVLQHEVDKVFVDPVLMEYIVRLVTATRQPKDYGVQDVAKYITYGGSPRASINIVLTARALAFMRGRSYVLAQDIADVAVDVLRHRIVLSYEALSDDVTPDTLVAKIMERIPVPAAPMQGHALVR